MLLCFFHQGFADEYGELRRDGFPDAIVFHPFVTRLEEHDLEECLSGAERRDGRPGVVRRFIPPAKQSRTFFCDGVARLAAD